MEFGSHDRRPRGEGIVPMINVVFLLLIFFLMTATMNPPEVSEIAPPDSASGSSTDVTRPLLVAADGSLRWGATEGDAVFDAIAVSWAADGAADAAGARTLIIRADARAEGARIAHVLNRLSEAGVERSALVTGGGAG